jgi:hypothetical protein
MSTISAGTTSGTALVSTGNTDGTLQLQVNGTTPSVTLAANGSIGVGSSPSYGTNGQLLTSSGAGSAPTWTTITSTPTIARSTRTSNTILAAADASTIIEITSGTFSQTFTAAATLGNGWFCYISNSGTGFVTLDPNASETITVRGVAATTWVLWPGEMGLIQCDGTGFYYYAITSGSISTATGTAASVTFATGIANRPRLRITADNFYVNGSQGALTLLVNSAVPTLKSLNYGLGAPTTYNTASVLSNSTGLLSGTGSGLNTNTSPYANAVIDITPTSTNTKITYFLTFLTPFNSNTGIEYNNGIAWYPVTISSITNIVVGLNGGTFSAGTITIQEIL